MSVQVTVEGFDNILTVLDPVRAVREVDSAVDRSAVALRDETKRMPPVSVERTGYAAKGIPVAPKYGGTMRQGIEKKKIGLMAADVFTGGGGSGYGGYVHDGTSKMQARPFFQWLLDDFSGREIIRAIVEGALERIATP